MADSTSNQGVRLAGEDSEKSLAADLRERVETLLSELHKYSAVRHELDDLMEDEEFLGPLQRFRAKGLLEEERKLGFSMVSLALPLMNDAHTFLMEDEHPKHQAVFEWFRKCDTYLRSADTLQCKSYQAYQDLDRLKTHLANFENLEAKNAPSPKTRTGSSKRVRSIKSPKPDVAKRRVIVANSGKRSAAQICGRFDGAQSPLQVPDTWRTEYGVKLWTDAYRKNDVLKNRINSMISKDRAAIGNEER